MNNWIIGAIVASHFFVFFLGSWNGRRKATDEMAYRQMRMEATKMWVDSIGGGMGGKK